MWKEIAAEAISAAVASVTSNIDTDSQVASKFIMVVDDVARAGLIADTEQMSLLAVGAQTSFDVMSFMMAMKLLFSLGNENQCI